MNAVMRAAATFILVLAMLAPAAATAGAHGEQPQPPQEEFIPIDELPPGDQMPAAPLLIAAYAIVWAVVFVYLWSIWRRLSTVEREMQELARRADAGEEGS